MSIPHGAVPDSIIFSILLVSAETNETLFPANPIHLIINDLQ
jgi:hypothetical protein